MGTRSPIGRLWSDWTGHPLAFTFEGLVVASLFYSLPFAVQPVATAFSQIDPALREASATLGASPLRTFFRVVLPLSIEGVVAGAVLSFAHTVGEFGVVLMVGGNLPGRHAHGVDFRLRPRAGAPVPGSHHHGALHAGIRVRRPAGGVRPAPAAAGGRAAAHDARRSSGQAAAVGVRARRVVRGRGRRHDPVRRLGFGQDHHPALRGRARAARRRPHRDRRSHAVRRRRRRRRAGAAPPDRLRVPAARALSAPDGRAEHRLRPRRSAAAERAGARRRGWPSRSASRSLLDRRPRADLRRRAAADRAGARARHQSGRAAARRAAVGARLRHPAAHHGRPAALERRAPHPDPATSPTATARRSRSASG